MRFVLIWIFQFDVEQDAMHKATNTPKLLSIKQGTE